MHWRPTILDTSPMHRQTTSVHCHHIASARQPSSTLRQAWRFFWNVQKNRQASPTVASEYSVVKWLSALRQPSPSYSSSSPMRRKQIVSVFGPPKVNLNRYFNRKYWDNIKIVKIILEDLINGPSLSPCVAYKRNWKKKNQISAYNTSSVDLNRSTYPTTLDAAILLCIYI